MFHSTWPAVPEEYLKRSVFRKEWKHDLQLELALSGFAYVQITFPKPIYSLALGYLKQASYSDMKEMRICRCESLKLGLGFEKVSPGSSAFIQANESGKRNRFHVACWRACVCEYMFEFERSSARGRESAEPPMAGGTDGGVRDLWSAEKITETKMDISAKAAGFRKKGTEVFKVEDLTGSCKFRAMPSENGLIEISCK
ncbi:hypothetical protein J437_LFUL009428 [Ladona fulva]|uniref:Uncharacterized protein n=1 Tax=Ladona fulva TaxID=123851 RepID=A0A8K0K5W7_LADFU|nr:hypothetical protein J437_LFUL009428 [Ladona fulva]